MNIEFKKCEKDYYSDKRAKKIFNTSGVVLNKHNKLLQLCSYQEEIFAINGITGWIVTNDFDCKRTKSIGTIKIIFYSDDLYFHICMNLKTSKYPLHRCWQCGIKNYKQLMFLLQKEYDNRFPEAELVLQELSQKHLEKLYSNIFEYNKNAEIYTWGM